MKIYTNVFQISDTEWVAYPLGLIFKCNESSQNPVTKFLKNSEKSQTKLEIWIDSTQTLLGVRKYESRFRPFN